MMNLLIWIYSCVEMELTLVGLQNSGKTTLVNVIAVMPMQNIARPDDDYKNSLDHTLKI